MPNLHRFADFITMESIRILTNTAHFPQFFSREYNKEYQREFPIGDTLRVKLPHRFTIRDGLASVPIALDRQFTTITVQQPFGIDFDWDSAEKALNMERSESEIRKELIVPAMSKMKTELDSRLAQHVYLNTNNVVGTHGTNPTTMTPYHDARAVMSENAAPTGQRGTLISSAMMSSIVVANLAVFNPVNELARAWKDGYYGRAAGSDWYESQNLFTHTSGDLSGGAVTVSGEGQSGTTLNIAGTNDDTFLAGDHITIGSAGTAVNNVNPDNLRTTGRLKSFKIMAAATVAGGIAALSILPSIVGPGTPYQNVSQLPGNGAVITGTLGDATDGKFGCCIAPDAYALVGVPLETYPDSVISSQKRDPDSGLAIRLWQASNIENSRKITRFDMMIGLGNLYSDQSAVLIAALR